jgi:hypothetical protein
MNVAEAVERGISPCSPRRTGHGFKRPNLTTWLDKATGDSREEPNIGADVVEDVAGPEARPQ